MRARLDRGLCRHIRPATQRGAEQRPIGGQQERGRKRALQRAQLEQLVEHAQRIALVQPNARRLRPSSRRAMMLVVDDGARREPDVVTEEIQPPAELDVLVVRERPFVPRARVDEHGAIDSIAQPQANSSGFSSSVTLPAGAP